jgi:hypothetical protein
MTPGKIAALLVMLVLVASSLTMVTATSVDDIPKPSVPEFSVKLVAYPYDVPPKTTTTIDQYTGKETTTTTPGYHVENKSIEITIKNPQFTPIQITEYDPVMHYWYEGEPRTGVECNNTANLYYSVRVKGHFGTDWTTPEIIGSSLPKLTSEYTVITCKADYPNEAQIDFQVQARTGFSLPYGRNIMIFGYDFYGQESGWSNTQVLTMGEVGTTAVPMDPPTSTPAPTASPTETVAPTPTPEHTKNPQLSPTTTPTQQIEQTETDSGFKWETTIAIVSIIIVGLAAALVLSKRRHKTPNLTY